MDIFFALSGILICSRLLDEEKNQFGRISLRGFYIRRIFRIQPAALLYLLVIGTLAFFSRLPLKPGAFFSALLLYRNHFPFHGRVTETTALTNHFWFPFCRRTLLLFLSGFLPCCKRNRVWALGAVVILFAVYGVVSRHMGFSFSKIGPLPMWHTELRLDSILVPAMIALMLAKQQVRRIATTLINPYCSIAISLALMLWQSQNNLNP